jgi:hypothetical protein
VALYVLSGDMGLATWQHAATNEAGDFGDPVGFGQYTEDSSTRNLVTFAALGLVAVDHRGGHGAIMCPRLIAVTQFSLTPDTRHVARSIHEASRASAFGPRVRVARWQICLAAA